MTKLKLGPITEEKPVKATLELQGGLTAKENINVGDHVEAAALPLTAITAWKMLFDRLDIRRPVPGAADAIQTGIDAWFDPADFAN